MNSILQAFYEGLWKNNVSFAQLLGLCPLLAISTNIINALGLGIATTVVLTVTNTIISLFRHLIPPAVRLPVFVLIIASLVTTVEMLIKAFFYDLYLVLGIFLPLIVTNCFLVGRAEIFAFKNAVARAAIDGLTMGIGFTLVLVILGGIRELIGQGTLLANAELMFGDFGKTMTLTVLSDYRGFLLAILPPGAFIGLGLLIALKNTIDRRLERRRKRTASYAKLS